MASLEGLRMALPNLSKTIKEAATGQFSATAKRGTARRFMLYPKKVVSQYFPVLSLIYPETSLNPYPINSPNPATIPTIKPLAPNRAKNCPEILRAPSYVMSAKRLTKPMSITNLIAETLDIE